MSDSDPIFDLGQRAALSALCRRGNRRVQAQLIRMLAHIEAAEHYRLVELATRQPAAVAPRQRRGLLGRLAAALFGIGTPGAPSVASPPAREHYDLARVVTNHLPQLLSYREAVARELDGGAADPAHPRTLHRPPAPTGDAPTQENHFPSTPPIGRWGTNGHD